MLKIHVHFGQLVRPHDIAGNSAMRAVMGHQGGHRRTWRDTWRVTTGCRDRLQRPQTPGRRPSRQFPRTGVGSEDEVPPQSGGQCGRKVTATESWFALERGVWVGRAGSVDGTLCEALIRLRVMEGIVKYLQCGLHAFT